MFFDSEIMTNRNGFAHCTVCGGDNGADDATVPVAHAMMCESEDATDQKVLAWENRGEPNALDFRGEHDSTL